MGVFGDESATDSGEESTSSGGGGLATLPDALRLGRTEVAAESTVEALVTSDGAPFALSPRAGGCVGRMNVRWLDARLDAIEIFDFPALDVDLETYEESLELGLSSPCRSSSLTDAGVPDLFFCPDKSVSGGEGGLSLL